MIDLNELNKLVFDCSVNLEGVELRKQKVKDLLDKMLNDDILSVLKKLN